MKKIVILSLVCLISGPLFAQSTTNTAAKTTTRPKLESTPVVDPKAKADAITTVAPVDLKVKKVEPTTAVSTTKVADKKVVPVASKPDVIIIAPLPPEGVAPVPAKADPIKKEKE